MGITRDKSTYSLIVVRGPRLVPSGKLTYPTKREVWKIIDSKVPTGREYISSMEGIFPHFFAGDMSPFVWLNDQLFLKSKSTLKAPLQSHHTVLFRNVNFFRNHSPT